MSPAAVGARLDERRPFRSTAEVGRERGDALDLLDEGVVEAAGSRLEPLLDGGSKAARRTPSGASSPVGPSAKKLAAGVVSEQPGPNTKSGLPPEKLAWRIPHESGEFELAEGGLTGQRLDRREVAQARRGASGVVDDVSTAARLGLEQVRAQERVDHDGGGVVEAEDPAHVPPAHGEHPPRPARSTTTVRSRASPRSASRAARPWEASCRTRRTASGRAPCRSDRRSCRSRRTRRRLARRRAWRGARAGDGTALEARRAPPPTPGSRSQGSARALSRRRPARTLPWKGLHRSKGRRPRSPRLHRLR
jgi:hypothetical protein